MKKSDFLEEVFNRYSGQEVSSDDLGKVGYSLWRQVLDPYKLKKGKYLIPHPDTEESKEEIMRSEQKKTNPVDAENSSIGYIPDVDPLYVPFGFYDDLKTIVKKNIFFPVFITGLSGNGKTKMVEQVCAKLNKILYRVNITIETDETDLIGGFRLKDGNTIFEYGPAIQAMKDGAVLLVDEIDLASSKIMCLQSILEGAPYHIKKTGETIIPVKGFTIVSTANTKGRGSEDGRFVGANLLNEAFLERFPITVEQEYPDEKTEIKIINKIFKSLNVDNEDFANNLAKWAKLIREGFKNGSLDELISTRRLAHIASTFAIFEEMKGAKMKSIKLCLARFDEETKLSLLDSYTKIDPNPENKVPVITPNTVNTVNNGIETKIIPSFTF